MTVNHHVLFLFSLDGLRAKFKRTGLGWGGGGGKGKAGAGVKCQAGERWVGKKKLYRRREVSERGGGRKKERSETG